MKKTILALALTIPVLGGCQLFGQAKVVFPFADETQTLSGETIRLNSYASLRSKVDAQDTFVLVIGNQSCTCTSDFLPLLSTWMIDTKLPVHYLEFSLLLNQTEQFGIPLLTGNTPLLTIFDQGELKFDASYTTRDTNLKKIFLELPALVTWFEQRITFPSFQFLTKANFDRLFTTKRNMIIYIGREDCPDCQHAFTTFLSPWLRTTNNLPPIYGLDVMRNGIRIPTLPGSESTTGNNTPGWSEFKTNYGMDNQWNTTFGYATGFVPTFMYIETDGQSIQTNPNIIKDMVVTYNDSVLQNPSLAFDATTNPRTTKITRTFFDGTRPLQYTTLTMLNQDIGATENSTQLRQRIESQHNQAMLDFFNYYLGSVDR